MQSVYWFCFAIGGVFVALSVFGGGDLLEGADADFDTDLDFDVDADLDIDADFDADVDADVDADLDGGMAVGAGPDLQLDTDLDLLRNAQQRRRLPGWISILTSFKFWTFGGCFFGLSGLLMGWLEPGLSPLVVLLVSLAVGLLCGGTLATALRSLKGRQVNSLVRNEDFAGLMGTVELPFDADSKGKVLLEVGGSTLHLVAQTDEKRDFKPGDAVLVVGRTNNRLWVVSVNGSGADVPG